MKWINYLFVFIIGIWFALMGILNSAAVPFNYAFGKGDVPLVLIMLVCFVIGALFSLLIFGFSAWFWRSRAHALGRQIDREHREADEAAIKARFEEEVQQR
ncbi:MAG: LapA family protein [Cardiobacteriaceae bacterium]|nr:LapA family protein [Cardiobacteriaceae bacterium]